MQHQSADLLPSQGVLSILTRCHLNTNRRCVQNVNLMIHPSAVWDARCSSSSFYYHFKSVCFDQASNILLERDNALLSDFGIACLFGAQH